MTYKVYGMTVTNINYVLTKIMEDKVMKKLFAALTTIAMIAACSVSAFAAGELNETQAPADNATPGVSDVTPGASSGDADNAQTGVVLAVVPAALAAGALTVSGIVLKKKNK